MVVVVVAAAGCTTVSSVVVVVVTCRSLSQAGNASAAIPIKAQKKNFFILVNEEERPGHERPGRSKFEING